MYRKLSDGYDVVTFRSGPVTPPYFASRVVQRPRGNQRIVPIVEPYHYMSTPIKKRNPNIYDAYYEPLMFAYTPSRENVHALKKAAMKRYLRRHSSFFDPSEDTDDEE